MGDHEPTVATNWLSPLPAPRILVADDNENIRALMADLLPIMGYAVTTACDGHKAIEELGRCEPHLVLLDIEMPGLDGCEVCRRIKSHPDTRSIPVVLVSGHPDALDRAAGAGADGFLKKPFQIEELLGWLKSLLGPVAARTAEPG
jgi:CheY-like chemotaxis protein